jgi:hypothetical protein
MKPSGNYIQRRIAMSTKCMRTSTLLIILVALSVILQSCATQEKAVKATEGTQLTHDEVVTLFSVPREVTIPSSKGDGTIKYTPNGNQTYIKGSFLDSGKYRIEEDRICGKWVKIRSGSEKCCKLYKINENVYQCVYEGDGKIIELIFK